MAEIEKPPAAAFEKLVSASDDEVERVRRAVDRDYVYAVRSAPGKACWVCHTCGDAWNEGEEPCECSDGNNVFAGGSEVIHGKKSRRRSKR